jgi:hypothetical protein
MIRARLTDVLASAILLAATAAYAQTPGPAPIAPGNTVLFAQYECDAAQLAKADKLATTLAGPVLNKHVAAGRLLTWGWTGVYLGGPENRAFYVWAKDPVALMQARAVYLPEIQALPDFAAFAQLCPRSTISVHNLIGGAPPPK